MTEAFAVNVHESIKCSTLKKGGDGANIVHFAKSSKTSA